MSGTPAFSRSKSPCPGCNTVHRVQDAKARRGLQQSLHQVSLNEIKYLKERPKLQRKHSTLTAIIFHPSQFSALLIGFLFVVLVRINFIWLKTVRNEP
jgi:hypothetical protein